MSKSERSVKINPEDLTMGIAFSSQNPTSREIRKHEGKINGLLKGMDVEKVDPASLDFRYGYASALANIYEYINLAKLTPQQEKTIREVNGLPVLRYIGENPGLTISTMSYEFRQGRLSFGRRIAKLRRQALLSQGKSSELEKYGWELSDTGITALTVFEAKKSQNELKLKLKKHYK